jgi:hypothetical protein
MNILKISNIEYTRGILTSILSSAVTQIFVFLTSKSQIKHKDVILYILTFIVANLLSYSLDILLAKANFGGKRISLYDQSFRFKYLIKKFFTYQLVKFFIVVCIDLIIVNSVFKRVIKFLDEKDIKFRNRDQIVMFLLTTFSFILYGNMLRFEWVYVEKTNLTLDVLLLSWLSILFFINIRT